MAPSIKIGSPLSLPSLSWKNTTKPEINITIPPTKSNSAANVVLGGGYLVIDDKRGLCRNSSLSISKPLVFNS